MKTRSQKPEARSQKENCIGRLCVVRDTKHRPSAIIEARVIDQDQASRQLRRIRLLTGEHAGEVRAAGEFQLLEWMPSHEAAAEAIGAAWGD
jgi:hypothetical protein